MRETRGEGHFREEELEALAGGAAAMEEVREAGRLMALGRNGEERAESFWAGQRVKIRERVEAEGAPWRRREWALAFAAVVLLAAAASWQSATPVPPTTTQLAEDADHLLLLDVRESAGRPVARALAPAMLLTAEMDEAAKRAPEKKN